MVVSRSQIVSVVDTKDRSAEMPKCNVVHSIASIADSESSCCVMEIHQQCLATLSVIKCVGNSEAIEICFLSANFE